MTDSGLVAALPEPVSERSSFSLGEEERDALIRVLYVVKDNWWLDEREENLLQRLLAAGPPAGGGPGGGGGGGGGGWPGGCAGGGRGGGGGWRRRGGGTGRAGGSYGVRHQRGGDAARIRRVRALPRGAGRAVFRPRGQSTCGGGRHRARARPGWPLPRRVDNAAQDLERGRRGPCLPRDRRTRR